MAELDSTLRTCFAQSKFAAKANFFKLPVFESGAFKLLVFKLPVFRSPVFRSHASSHDLLIRPTGQIMGRLNGNRITSRPVPCILFLSIPIIPTTMENPCRFFLHPLLFVVANMGL